MNSNISFSDIKDIVPIVIVPIVTVLAPIFISRWLDIKNIRNRNLQEEYRFAKDFFSEISSTSEMSSFLQQKGYEAIAGNTHLSWFEIKYLLQFPEPVKAIDSYTNGKSYLKYKDKADCKIVFKRTFKRKGQRLFKKALYVLGYCGSVLLAIHPFFLFNSNVLLTSSGALYSLIAMICSIPMAIWMSKKHANIGLAEELMRSQKKLLSSRRMGRAEGEIHPPTH